MPRGVKKENLPSKVCVTCGRPFTWRKKWERCWDEVTTCSKSCNRKRRQVNNSHSNNSNSNNNKPEDSSFTSHAERETTVVPSAVVTTMMTSHNDIRTDNDNEWSFPKADYSRVHPENEQGTCTSTGRQQQQQQRLHNDDGLSLLAKQLESSLSVSNDNLNNNNNNNNNNDDEEEVILPPTTTTDDDDDDEEEEDDPKARRKAEKKRKKQQRRAQREGRGDPTYGQKQCDLCPVSVDLLIRCTIDESGQWKMVCGKCWHVVSGGVVDGDSAHPHYRYGGLWKNRRRQ